MIQNECVNAFLTVKLYQIHVNARLVVVYVYIYIQSPVCSLFDVVVSKVTLYKNSSPLHFIKLIYIEVDGIMFNKHNVLLKLILSVNVC